MSRTIAFNKVNSLVLLFSSFVFCCLLSFIYLKYFAEPWIWICITASAILIALAFAVKNNYAKILLFNLAAFPIALFLAEVYLYIDSGGATRTLTRMSNYSKKDEILGYAPVPSIQKNVKSMQGDEVIYDVTYTINANGLRHTPSSDSSSKSCLLFFGGSFTFGEGLNDNETLPYLMGKALNEKYRIFNFGLP